MHCFRYCVFIDALPALRYVCVGLLVCANLWNIPANANERINGRTLYEQYCAQCHGADLRGGDGQSLVDGIWHYGKRDGHIKRNIKHGIMSMGMPRFETVLSDNQIDTVLSFIRQKEKEAVTTTSSRIPEKLQTHDYDIQVEVFVEGLEFPWAIAFPDAKSALITEQPGRLRVVRDGHLLIEPVRNIPRVQYEGQGGLLDVAVDPNYSVNGWVYLSYSHMLEEDDPERLPAMTRIVRGRIKNNTWVEQQVLYEAPSSLYHMTRHHYGSRIVFNPEGYMYFSIGDRGDSEQAQDVTWPNGKIHRIHRDGRVPLDNPFVGHDDAVETIFSYGHRNPQGLAVHPETGTVWETEHGPMGGDEMNVIRKGLNYGWPEISYGRNYDGTTLTEHVRKPGMEQPSLYWKPSIAVSGLDFYTGDLFPKWRNYLLVGALKYEELRLLNAEDNRIMHEEVILKNAGRVRDVTTGLDGAIYVVLNNPHTVIRLTPVSEY